VGPVGPTEAETGVPGSGSIAAEPREVAEFDQIVFRSEGKVIVGHRGGRRQEARVAGVSTYDASNPASRTTTIERAGMGQATIWVTEDLEVVAADTASVSYYGTPTVTERVSGSAKVIPLGAK